MPSYGRFDSLEHYLTARTAELDESITSLSEKLGYARSYLSSIAKGQFKPSIKRCREIAAFLDDDPSIILTLAGYMEPPPKEGETSAAVAGTVSGLNPQMQRMVLEFAEFLKTRALTRSTDMRANQLYVELPDGRTLTLDGDTSSVDESVLRMTLSAALNATLGREDRDRD